MPPLFTCLWFTDPRARVCRPNARSSAPKRSVTIEVGPDVPAWALVACPARRTRPKATRTVCPRNWPTPNPSPKGIGRGQSWLFDCVEGCSGNPNLPSLAPRVSRHHRHRSHRHHYNRRRHRSCRCRGLRGDRRRRHWSCRFRCPNSRHRVSRCARTTSPTGRIRRSRLPLGRPSRHLTCAHCEESTPVQALRDVQSARHPIDVAGRLLRASSFSALGPGPAAWSRGSAGCCRRRASAQS